MGPVFAPTIIPQMKSSDEHNIKEPVEKHMDKLMAHEVVIWKGQIKILPFIIIIQTPAQQVLVCQLRNSKAVINRVHGRTLHWRISITLHNLYMLEISGGTDREGLHKCKLKASIRAYFHIFIFNVKLKHIEMEIMGKFTLGVLISLITKYLSAFKNKWHAFPRSAV